MKCPACKETVLVMAERHGIEIDYCPDCRGVWLDRGELDKIIEQAAAPDVPQSSPRPAAGYQQQQPPPYYPPQKPQYSRDYEPHYNRKKKWWKEVFDL